MLTRGRGRGLGRDGRGAANVQISASDERLGVGVELCHGRETCDDGLDEVGTEPEEEGRRR